MRRISFASFLAVAMTAFLGCAQVPTQELDAARLAMDGARSAQADVYTPDGWSAAKDSQSRLDAELTLQQDRFPLFRSYSKVRMLAVEVKGAAERAAVEGTTARLKAKDEATGQMAQAREAYGRAQEALAKAPKGKGTEVDFASLRSDSGSIESTIQEMQLAFDAGDYHAAALKAQSVILAAKKIESEIENARRLRHPTA
jgi:hypothetical protein